ncbi:MAG: hypothetical protein GY703_23255 [Gammaproteobacteria bacterium]|nr:hypothetical protein [Gammaproteobacteria bacterium]
MTIDRVTGETRWIPQQADVGYRQVRVRVTDEGGLFHVQAFIVAVVNINDRPQLGTIADRNINEGEALSLPLAAVDRDGDSLRYMVAGLPAFAELIDKGDGTADILFPTGFNHSGHYFMAISVSDGELSDTQGFRLFVVETNDPPLITSTPPTVTIEGAVYAYGVQAQDPDDDPLAFDLPESPPGMSIDPVTGSIYWIPSGDQLGYHDLQVQVADGRGGIDLQTYRLLVQDHFPPVPDLPNLSAVSGICSATITQVPTATDSVSGTVLGVTDDPLSYSTGGDHTVTWNFDDGAGNSTTQIQILSVTDALAPIPDMDPLPDIEKMTVAWGKTDGIFTRVLPVDRKRFGVGTSHLETGGSPPVMFDFFGNEFQVTPDTVFSLGTLRIYNASISGGSGTDQIEFEVKVNFTAPSGVAKKLELNMGYTHTSVPWYENGHAKGADIVEFYSGFKDDAFTTPTFEVDGIECEFVFKGFGALTGSGFTSNEHARFHISEDDTASIELLAMIRVLPIPTAMDNCVGKVTGSTSDELNPVQPGDYSITWDFDDGNGNIAVQEQLFRIHDINAPIPTMEPLPDITEQCSVTISEIPTALDPEAGMLTAITDDSLECTGQGVHFVTWRFEDSNGNSASQEQRVVIEDTTPPTANVAVLPAVELPVRSSLLERPVALDNCTGEIEAETSDPLNYSVPGDYVVNWIYDDGYGNKTDQQQTIRVIDTQPPVPDVAILPPLTGQCEVTVESIPTATDPEDGALLATTDDPVHYDDQGEFFISWMYTDSFGNYVTQAQSVVVSDILPPVPDQPMLPLVSGEGTVSVSVVPTASDNCAGTIIATTDSQTTYSTPGDHVITWLFEDGSGHQLYQTQIVRVSLFTNRPEIVSIPVTEGVEAAAYVYDVEAIDPNVDDILAYSLVTAPTGMTIDSGSGLIEWTPTAEQIGVAIVTVKVEDPTGNSDVQSFSVDIQNVNQSPIITSTAPTEVSFSQDYSYQVSVEDPDGDLIGYQLVNAPPGMSISDDGLVSWPAGIERPTSAEVEVEVSDSHGGKGSQAWTIEVLDDRPPEVTLLLSSNMVHTGDRVQVQVLATSDVDIVGRHIVVGGMEIVLDPSGIGSYHATDIGFIEVVATATDERGNTGEAWRQLLVGGAGDNVYPEVELVSGEDGECLEATVPYSILGSVSDDTYVYYELAMRESGAQEWIPFESGEGEAFDGELGTFDPTVLRNGVHHIQLYALDTSGNIATREICALVDGQLKVGQVNFSQIDHSLPAPGVPLTVAREYDSRAQGPGDFGPGWNLPNRSVKVDSTVELGAAWGQQRIGGTLFDTYLLQEKQKHILTIRYGDEQLERFEMDVNPKSQNIVPLQYLTVGYEAMAGTHSSIEVLDASADVILQEPHLMTYDADVYAPKRFKVTRRDGSLYVIDMDSGIKSITDPNGSKVTYSEDGIDHSSGISIAFERGEGNRIERISDDFGTEYEYRYDADGYLAEVVQIGTSIGQRISRALSKYAYTKEIFGNSLEPKLKTVIAPDGIKVGTFEYDASGRLVDMTDADGNRILYGYDVPELNQTVTDRLGNETYYEFDQRGNVTLREDPLGRVPRWEYDADDNETAEVLPNGARTERTFNAAGDLLTETDPLGNLTRYTYDGSGRVLTRTDALGRVYTTERDTRGNPTLESGPGQDSIRSTYDDKGQLLTQKGSAGIVSAFTYDENGLVTKIDTYRESDPDVLLSRSTTQYDDLGRPTRAVPPVRSRWSMSVNPATPPSLPRMSMMRPEISSRRSRRPVPINTATTPMDNGLPVPIILGAGPILYTTIRDNW